MVKSFLALPLLVDEAGIPLVPRVRRGLPSGAPQLGRSAFALGLTTGSAIRGLPENVAGGGVDSSFVVGAGVDAAGHAGTEAAVAGIELGGDLRWYLLVLVALAEKYGYARIGGR